MSAAGFTDVREHEADCVWRYDDETALLRGLMSARRHRTSDGAYTLHNVFRVVTADAAFRSELRSVS